MDIIFQYLSFSNNQFYANKYLSAEQIWYAINVPYIAEVPYIHRGANLVSLYIIVIADN